MKLINSNPILLTSVMVLGIFIFRLPGNFREAQKYQTLYPKNSLTVRDQEDKDSTKADREKIEGDVARGKKLFQTSCASCHRVEGESTGPGLKGITKRAPSRQWIYDWIHNQREVLDSGDEYAQKLFSEYMQEPMPHFPGLSEEDIDDILAYIEK